MDVKSVAPAFARAWEEAKRRKGVSFARERVAEGQEETMENEQQETDDFLDSDRIRIIK